MMSQGGGLKGAVDFLPMQEIANALQLLYEAQGQTLQRIYEVTGISDIIRGQSNPYETAEGQRTKVSCHVRLKDRQSRWFV
jgi:hypothetical protein